MSNKFRKVLAAILAGTMVLGSGVVANAANGNGEGTGSLEIAEASDIFDVILPTSSGTTFDYILDPTGVIEKTNGANHGGPASASFVSGKTMYFRNKPAAGSTVATYSDVSDPITAYNLSTMDVEIEVEAKVATPSGIEIASSVHSDRPNGAYITAKGTATPSIYLGFKASSSTPNLTAITTTKRTVATASIDDAAKYYTITATESNGVKKYKKELDATGSEAKKASASNYNGIFKSYSFMLTGSCNTDGKWEGLTETPPTVSLVWTIQKPEGALEVTDGSGSSYLSASTITASNPSVTLTLPSGVTLTKIELLKSGATTPVTMISGSHFTVSNGKYTFMADMVSKWSGAKLTFTYSNGKSDVVTVK